MTIRDGGAGLPHGAGAELRRLWPLDPRLTYLNHGGFGVTPSEVLAVQVAWRDRMERDPSGFFWRELPGLVREAAEAVAAAVGARGADLVFVENATAGCNAVLRSLALAPGDEILLTSLAYNAVLEAARYAAERAAARVVVAEVPLPVADEAAILGAVASRLGPRTRLAVFDHIASSSALVLPVGRLAALARAAGARVLVDGAHAPGQLELDVPALGADWYVGNCHKWFFAPRGCGFLWAAPDAQAELHPLAISHGHGMGFRAEFDWTGTHDPSAWLSAPAGIACHERLGGARLRARNDGLARAAGRLLAEAWRTELAGPLAAFAAMTTVRLPLPGLTTREAALAWRDRLAAEHRIAAAVVPLAGALWVRISAQAYNELADYERLAAVFRT